MTSLPESPRARNRQAPDDRAKALRQQIDDSLDTLAKAVDEVRASETFRRYLDVQARFRRYSWHNSMLILCQKARRHAGSRLPGLAKARAPSPQGGAGNYDLRPAHVPPRDRDCER